MKSHRALPRRKAASGIAAIEMGFLLPILVFLTLPVIDFGRAIQANQILVNLTREGANLASRDSNDTPQVIMNTLSATTPPLKMPQRGMIYITKIMGYCAVSGPNCAATNVVLEQYEWLSGWQQASGAVPASKIWNCGGSGSSWAGDGSCGGIPSGGNAPPVSFMAGSLHDGDVAYVVDAYYNFDMLFSGLSLGGMTMPGIGPNLYSITVF